MSLQNNHSWFKLFKGEWVFNENDRPWFKLIVFIITLIFFLLLIGIVSEWSIFIVVGQKLIKQAGKLFSRNFFKNL
jgi:hypothetical protein